MIKIPCQNCRFRTAECHASCASYAEYVEDRKAEREQMNKQSEERNLMYFKRMPRRSRGSDWFK